jgi:hypothetical protein
MSDASPEYQPKGKKHFWNFHGCGWVQLDFTKCTTQILTPIMLDSLQF